MQDFPPSTFSQLTRINEPSRPQTVSPFHWRWMSSGGVVRCWIVVSAPSHTQARSGIPDGPFATWWLEQCSGLHASPTSRRATRWCGDGRERDVEYVGHAIRQVDLQVIEDMLGHVLEIVAVAPRQHDPAESGAVGGEQLLLDATDRQDQPL
jgi:hypothetical protein